MFEFKDGMIFYHGSYCEVKEPDLTKCSKEKDFGKGFYLTTSKDQAKSFLKTSIIKAVNDGKIKKNQNYGYISIYRLDLSHELKVHFFESTDAQWLHCIAAHRKNELFGGIENKMSKFDVIVGKIANDATNTTLTAYLGGAFGTVGEKDTDDFCIKQLLPNNLKDQYCFKTVTALECLKFVESEKIWIK